MYSVCCYIIILNGLWEWAVFAIEQQRSIDLFSSLGNQVTCFPRNLFRLIRQCVSVVLTSFLSLIVHNKRRRHIHHVAPRKEKEKGGVP
jgi:hypothetical protein